MKIPLLPAVLACLCLHVNAQTDTTRAVKPVHWKKAGYAALNFNNVQLVNWAAGGQNATAVTGLFNYSFNFKREYKRGTKTKTMTWDNMLDLAYGIIRTNKDPWRKNEDKLDLNSKFGYDAFGKWYYAALANFKSQFAPGYSLPNDSVRVSSFLSPAWVIASLGLDWKPKDWFSMYVSPATGKFTIVTNDSLNAAGAYGVDSGRALRPEFGAYAKLFFKRDVMKNVNISSRLDLFNNFTDKNKPNRRNIDVNWETTVNMKVNKYISASAFVHVIYDHDINIKREIEQKGVLITKLGPATQYKQVFGLAVSYKF